MIPSTPISPPELLKALENSYDDCTVRRWLAEVKKGIVLKEGKKRGTLQEVNVRPGLVMAYRLKFL